MKYVDLSPQTLTRASRVIAAWRVEPEKACRSRRADGRDGKVRAAYMELLEAGRASS